MATAALLATYAARTVAQEGQPTLPTIVVTAGIHIVRAEVANTFPTRSMGLMFRKKMAANDGMLFLFSDESRHCMWMKNTYLPLSVAFIDAAGVVTNIVDMKPHDETSHCATRTARYALEMNQGWFAVKGIKAGVKLGGIDTAPPPR